MGNGNGMRVVVTGTTGNVGTSVVRALSEDPAVSSVLGLARRPSEWSCAKTEFVEADITGLARGAAVEVFTYPGAGHFYTDADLPDHDEQATALTWQRILPFLSTLTR
jgi:nucleoside-diphosphate-sugar epimerase